MKRVLRWDGTDWLIAGYVPFRGGAIPVGCGWSNLPPHPPPHALEWAVQRSRHALAGLPGIFGNLILLALEGLGLLQRRPCFEFAGDLEPIGELGAIARPVVPARSFPH
jgi:hypothetical protein